ncbi:MAG TPA: cyclase family protein [Dehalococcoidia bacterium]
METVGLAQFTAMFDELKNWGRWGADDQRGTLNLITPAKRVQAAGLVSEGTVVSAASPLPTRPGPNNFSPAVRAVLIGGDSAGDGFHSAGDLTMVAPHGFAVSHLDALCHVFWNRQMYNGYPAGEMGATGANRNAIDEIRDGVVTRGVLLDIPALDGRRFLRKGETITVEQLEAAEKRQNVRVEEGDALLVYTGRRRREAAESETMLMEGAAGLHLSAMPWIKQRGVALLGSDGVSDVMPSGCEGVILPVHTLTIVALGLHLLDNLALDALADACASRYRWAFQFVVAPLIIERGTGSAVNPLAIF